MAYTHIAHDCRVGKMVVLANNATLGRATSPSAIMPTVGGLVAIHQFVRIGDHRVCRRKIRRGQRCPAVRHCRRGSGRPAWPQPRGPETLSGSLNQALAALKKTYRILFRYGLTLNEAIERVHAEVEILPEVENFINFIKASSRGVTR
jgi:UDP-N-acetylglucosamine acyltransferase